MGDLPASHQLHSMGAFLLQVVTDAIQVCQCRVGIARGRPTSELCRPAAGAARPCRAALFTRQRHRPAPPAVTASLQRTLAVSVPPYNQWFVGARNQQGGALGCTILSQTGS